MPGFSGDFDHFGLDRKGNRLFLAAEEHKTVEVFDLRTGARTHSIEGFGRPLTMFYLPESNHLIVTDGGDSAVHLVDCKKYRILKTIKLALGVDHGVLNPVNQRYYMENGGDPSSSTHVLSIYRYKVFQTHWRCRGTAGKVQRGHDDRPGRKKAVRKSHRDGRSWNG